MDHKVSTLMWPTQPSHVFVEYCLDILDYIDDIVAKNPIEV